MIPVEYPKEELAAKMEFTMGGRTKDHVRTVVSYCGECANVIETGQNHVCPQRQTVSCNRCGYPAHVGTECNCGQRN